MVELLAAGGIIRPHGLTALVGGRVADGSVDDGLGGETGGDHTGGTGVVGHVGKGTYACARTGRKLYMLWCGVGRSHWFIAS